MFEKLRGKLGIQKRLLIKAWEKIVPVLFAFNQQETNQASDENFVFKLLSAPITPVCCCKVETQFPEMSHNSGRDNNSFR